MAQVTFRQPASPHEVFAPDALDWSIGKQIPISTPTAQGAGILLKAEVIEDGAAMLLTVVVPEDVAEQLRAGGEA